ncbi:MAG TPA: GNAT family N-acetyltransferase [Geminicoccus sp.]|uniref:GNAT family N-acetyltransferase n=1 Tax=Geminicoccus sp. TaxID=2024832 RepID=UPI002E37761C|nr:GNAT family N-acetyltransferase [Geminicoccus sp.]HEX2524679.1 GNAT family N-acetyltransferase [Geminicoccus sp.]
MRFRISDGVQTLDPHRWDGLVGDADPFMTHAFFTAMESSDSASDETGWQPLAAVVEREGALVAAAPLYAKGHSWGEYVFDHGWADAFRRAGGSYYPKLQVAVPFTPVPGTRLPAVDDAARDLLIQGLKDTLAATRLSSLHVTFCTEDEWTTLDKAGFLQRIGLQYHLSNPGYRDFQDFLDSLRSSKRKMIRKERQAVEQSGLTIETLTGAELGEGVLDDFWPFYLATVEKRWGNAYLTQDFFRRLGRTLGEKVVLVRARQGKRTVAVALNLAGRDALYGRIWGSLEEYRFLHFELCYYRAIEWAIAHKLPRVEAGAQGVHKVQRGYAPVLTYSAHLISHSGLRDAIARFLRQERLAVEHERAELQAALPYSSQVQSDDQAPRTS